MLKNLDKILFLYLMLMIFSFANDKYIIFSLGKEPVEKMTSNKITSIEEISVIGYINVNEKNKVEEIYFNDLNKYNFMDKFLIEDKIEMLKIKEEIKKKYEKWPETLFFLGGGIDFFILEPVDYDESETEILNLIKFLQRAGQRIAVLDYNMYSKYLEVSDEEKIKMLKEQVRNDVILKEN